MYDAWVDLLLGSHCVHCGRHGRLLCPGCAATLPESAVPAWPTPCPPGLAIPVAAGEYAGVLKDLVIGHKERHQFSLCAPLGAALACAARGLAAADEPCRSWLLVPVPSRGGVVRSRGHDPMLRVTRRAAVLLRRQGYDVRVAGLLRGRGTVADQSGLDAVGRAANLVGTMYCPADVLARVATRSPQARVIVCDDVITTGATAREGQRALENVGVTVTGIATVAATRRRHPGGRQLAERNSRSSLPILRPSG